MKHLTITFLYLFFTLSLTAQQKIELKPEIGGGFVFCSFTSDSLIPPNRTNAFTMGYTGFVNVRMNFLTKDLRWLFSTGAGITTNRLIIRENNGFDRFFDQFLLFWGSGGNLPVKDILIKHQNINLPLGFAYNLSGKKPDKFQSFVGVDAVLQFNIGKQVKLNAPSYNYTDSERKQITEDYKKRVNPFVIMIMPKLEFRTSMIKNTRHIIILSPFALYNQSQLKGLTVNPVSMHMGYAVSFQLN